MGSQQLYEIKQALEALEAKVSERAHSPFQPTHPAHTLLRRGASCLSPTHGPPRVAGWLAVWWAGPQHAAGDGPDPAARAEPDE